MSQSPPVTGEQLTHALRELGVKFVWGEKEADETLHKQPVRLITALAESSEARLRLSLIPLFLEHPEFSHHAVTAAQTLPPAARLTLHCYYTAAVWLQAEHRARLETLLGVQPSLPDLFSSTLEIAPEDDPGHNLQSLAKRHKELSGEAVNWLGTYRHAAHIWLRGLEIQNA